MSGSQLPGQLPADGSEATEMKTKTQNVTLGATKPAVFVMIFSLLMAFTFCATVYDASAYNAGLKFMTMKWTTRSSKVRGESLDTMFKGIETLYKTNKDTTPEGLTSVAEQAFKTAGCLVTTFDGQISWKASEVSPTCHCLRNWHLAYIKAVTPQGKRLLTQEMTDSSDELTTMVQKMKRRCFDAIRGTQFEETNQLNGSNLVVVGACWNLAALATSLYVLRSMQTEEELRNGWWNTGFAATCLVSLLLVAAGFTAVGYDVSAQGVTFMAFAFLYAAYILMSTWNKQKSIATWTAFWYGALFYLPALSQGMNGVMQRRDLWCNHNTGVLTACLCLISIALGHMEFSDMHNAKDSPRRRAQRGMKFLCALCACCVVLALFSFSFPSLPTTPFFNAQFTMVAVSGLMAFPALYNFVFLHRFGNPSDSTYAKKTDSFMEIYFVEFLARTIFTFSLMSDLWGMRYTDVDTMWS